MVSYLKNIWCNKAQPALRLADPTMQCWTNITCQGILLFSCFITLSVCKEFCPFSCFWTQIQKVCQETGEMTKPFGAKNATDAGHKWPFGCLETEFSHKFEKNTFPLFRLLIALFSSARVHLSGCRFSISWRLQTKALNYMKLN